MRAKNIMKKILIINGPNLNFLGKRETSIYGTKSLEEIAQDLSVKIPTCEFEWYQSNVEGEIVDRIQKAMSQSLEAIIINPAGYSHTSVAIYDALKMHTVEIIEVHLSQVYQREEFRHRLLTGRAASKIMSGFGNQTYYYAALSVLEKKE